MMVVPTSVEMGFPTMVSESTKERRLCIEVAIISSNLLSVFAMA
jgi:hypothetical protein